MYMDSTFLHMYMYKFEHMKFFGKVVIFFTFVKNLKVSCVIMRLNLHDRVIFCCVVCLMKVVRCCHCQSRVIHGQPNYYRSSVDVHIYPIPPLSEYPQMTKLLQIIRGCSHLPHTPSVRVSADDQVTTDHPWMFTFTPYPLCQSIRR